MATKKTKQQIIKKLVKDETALYEKEGVRKRVVITFPTHDKVPLLGKVALWFLKKSKARLDYQFNFIKK